MVPLLPRTFLFLKTSQPSDVVDLMCITTRKESITWHVSSVPLSTPAMQWVR